MNRKDFVNNKSRKGIFYPSVGEVWQSADGQILLYKEWEDGFNCVGYDRDMTLNFNHLPPWWMETHQYIKTISQDEIAAVIRQRKANGYHPV